MNLYNGVEDTLLIPLAARCFVSKNFPLYFQDNVSLEIGERLDIAPILKESSEYTMFASVARYKHIDDIIREFCNTHQEANIVNLGCGLETAPHRLNLPSITFYEVDFPKVIAQRKSILATLDNEVLLASDIFDFRWLEQIEKDKPTLFIASGVFQYLHEEEVCTFIEEMKRSMSHAELVFDATNQKGLKYANRYVKKTGNTSAKMYFYVDDATAFCQKTHVKLKAHRVFFKETLKTLRGKLRWTTRLSMIWADTFDMAKIIWIEIPSDL